jgi:serine/threonine protein phosphatase PrpC
MKVILSCRDFFNQRDALVYARNAFRAGKSAQNVADGLVDRALKRYTADNVAVIVVKFPWAFKS